MPDARVHGRLAGGESGFSPEILTEDVIALMQAFKLEQPILIGRSNGALTAFLIAMKTCSRSYGRDGVISGNL
jgi:pimeloyl-ACP methyl ester carboxylesterase